MMGLDTGTGLWVTVVSLIMGLDTGDELWVRDSGGFEEVEGRLSKISLRSLSSSSSRRRLLRTSSSSLLFWSLVVLLVFLGAIALTCDVVIGWGGSYLNIHWTVSLPRLLSYYELVLICVDESRINIVFSIIVLLVLSN